MNAQAKLLKLKTILQNMGEVTLAYSGGVDSTFLLKVATDTLGNRCLGVLAISPTFPSREYERAIHTARSMGAQIRVLHTYELENENFVRNPVNRCYYCKSELFGRIAGLAGEEGYRNFIDGSNVDDLRDHRPGRRAMKEKNVRSPLQEAGLSKNDIRELSREMGLPTWDKDALACLSSRFPYGERISIRKLKRVDAAENYLKDLGFNNVRARHMGHSVRIEVDPGQVALLLEAGMREKVEKRLRAIGYKEVSFDPEGYRQGKLNDG